MTLAILIPVYDDYPSLNRVIAQIHSTLSARSDAYEIFVVDDASPRARIYLSEPARPGNCMAVTLLRLRKNLGHQRAIAVGLVYICARTHHDLVVVMDGDGEDAPSDIPRLVTACVENGQTKAVFARRTRRWSGALFKFGYEAYCLLHRVAVGSVPRVGNFCALPRTLLDQLVVDPNLWNHFAAAAFSSRLPIAQLPTARGRRYEGQSKLRLNDLIIHGLSALACYSEKIGVRVLLATGAMLALSAMGMAIVMGLRLFTTRAIPGWATVATGVLLILSAQILTFGVAFCLVVLSRRQSGAFLPARDALIYLAEQRAL